MFIISRIIFVSAQRRLIVVLTKQKSSYCLFSSYFRQGFIFKGEKIIGANGKIAQIFMVLQKPALVQPYALCVTNSTQTQSCKSLKILIDVQDLK